MLIEISKGVDKLKFDKETFHSYREKIVQFGRNPKTTEAEI